MSARTVPSETAGAWASGRAAGSAAVGRLVGHALTAVLVGRLIFLELLFIVAADRARAATEIVVAIGLAVGVHRFGSRLDRFPGIAAAAFRAGEMLGDLVVARFVAGGKRMALPAHP